MPALTILLLAAAAQPAFAARCHCHGSRHGRETVSATTDGSVIAVTYQRGDAQRVRFLQVAEAIDRVAIRDVDNDGDLDIIAAPRDGRLLLWRNAGHGRFSLASLPRGRSLASRGPRFERVQRGDDGWQWGVEHHGAAMPRAPAIATVVPIALVRIPPQVSLRSAALPSSSGRAPPVA